MDLREGNSIFLILGFTRLPVSPDEPPVTARVCGWYKEHISAIEAVCDNVGDIHAGKYEYVVIGELPQGVLRPYRSVQWFRWEPNGEYYSPVDDPSPSSINGENHGG